MNPVEAAFAPLFGKPCWNVRNTYAMYLLLEFGTPHDERYQEDTYPVGEWHLWIYSCEWKLWWKNRPIADWNHKDDVARAVSLLDGQVLISVKILSNGRAAFTFTNGLHLHTRPFIQARNKKSDCFILFEPNDMALALRGDGFYCHEPDDTEPAHQQYQRLVPRGG